MHDLGRCFNLNSFGVRHDISMAILVAILSCNPMKVYKNTGLLFFFERSKICQKCSDLNADGRNSDSPVTFADN